MYLLRKSFMFQRKLCVCYEHIRLKSSTEKDFCSVTNSKDAIKIRINKLAELLDCTPLTARKIILKNKDILSIPNETFSRNAQFCMKWLKFSDIVEFPIIISLNSSLLQHRYYVLMELGCRNITASIILKFAKIIKKSPNSLKKHGIVFHKDLYMDQYMDILDSENKSDIKLRIQKMYEDDSNLSSIKEAMNAEFLASKLDFSLFEVQQMFKRYPPLRIQSIWNTNQVIDVLFQTYRFSNLKVFSAPNLLSVHQETLQEFLINMPTILEVSTLQLANKLPLLLRQSVDSLQKIETILKDFHISGNQLLCCPKVLTCTPSVVHERLTALCDSEDFAFLKCCEKFLLLILHYNKVYSRMQVLKQHGIPWSINMFTVSEKQFGKYLSVSKSRGHIKDIGFYLADLLGSSEIEILTKLKEYPNFHDSSVRNCNKVVEFLLQSGVKKEQIFNGVGIILYDVDVVKSYFKEMQNDANCQPFSEWFNHCNLIQLLIYKIEVDAGFKATQLYKIRVDVDELDDIAASNQSC